MRQLLEFFSYFRSYIDNFACLSKPLTELTKKYVPNEIIGLKLIRRLLRHLRIACAMQQNCM